MSIILLNIRLSRSQKSLVVPFDKGVDEGLANITKGGTMFVVLDFLDELKGLRAKRIQWLPNSIPDCYTPFYRRKLTERKNILGIADGSFIFYRGINVWLAKSESKGIAQQEAGRLVNLDNDIYSEHPFPLSPNDIGDYSLYSLLTFGKYKGETIKKIIDKDEQYISRCILLIDEFFISYPNLEEIIKYKPDFKLSVEAVDALYGKQLYIESETGNDYDETYWSHYDDNLDIDQQSSQFWDQF